MLRRRFLTAALVAAVTALVAAPTSQAGFQVAVTVGANSATITDNNTANLSAGSTANVTDTNPSAGAISTPQVTSTGSAASPFTVGGVLLGLSLFSDSFPSQALLSTSTDIVVRNTTGSAVSVTIEVSDQYTGPGAIGNKYDLVQSLTIDRFFRADGSTYSPGTSTSNSVTAFASATPAPASTSTIGSNTAVFSGTSSTLYTRTATPFTMSQTFTVLLQAGESVKFQGTASVTLAAPAPATAVMALTGAPLFGLFGWVRRRKAALPQV